MGALGGLPGSLGVPGEVQEAKTKEKEAKEGTKKAEVKEKKEAAEEGGEKAETKSKKKQAEQAEKLAQAKEREAPRRTWPGV